MTKSFMNSPLPKHLKGQLRPCVGPVMFLDQNRSVGVPRGKPYVFGSTQVNIIGPEERSPVEIMEKLCLQWNDFRANVHYAFKNLRHDKEFTDVTLACEDGQQMEAHKVILAASSPFFEKIL